MGFKVDYQDLYQGRIDEINRQIKIAVNKKQWGIKKNLEEEKKRLQVYLQEVTANGKG